jgi:beta-lactamase class C
MDMLYHLPFRDWMELNKSPSESIADADAEQSDSGDGGGHYRR